MTHMKTLKALNILPKSWLFRIVAFLIVVISVISGAIFLSIDRFVSLQFSEIAAERLNYQASGIQRLLEREIARFEELAKLISTDSDLRHSALYNLYLEGSKEPLEADLKRVSETFGIELVTAWDLNGNLAASNKPPAPEELHDYMKAARALIREAHTNIIWINDEIWLVTDSPLKKEDEVIGIIQMARILRPADNLTLLLGPDAQLGIVSDADNTEKTNIIQIPIHSSHGQETSLQLEVPDPVAIALAKTKLVVGVTLIVSSILLSGIVVLSLRQQLRPIQALTLVASKAAPELERGEVKYVKVEGQAEVAQLVRAFNSMLDDMMKLRVLEKEIEQKDRLSAIGKVATSVAHDINNPLTVIKNTAILLRDEHKDIPTLVSDVNMIVHHATRCSRIVDNLLRFGRPLNLKVEQYELGQCLDNYLTNYHHRKSNLCYHFNNNGDRLMMSGDLYQLEQMLDNLINNAYQANSNNKIEISSGKFDDKSVFISITDDGVGFPENINQSVFTPFVSSKRGGTGLGLSNAQAIAKAHGGDIVITDAKRGQITVYLPYHFKPVL
ncbi:ATP-binding protein [Sedimenticola selenatireducens]|uniref:sensor histidine kinase n=1 Tax=Sedimenticola selenatireducens TaxID=191960 RepID=UPI002AABEF80|nr:ATP-binding protein [Sedimenticola selenatireducens]